MRDFAYQIVYSTIFWVLTITYSQDVLADFDAKYVRRRGSGQGCTFSGSQNKNLTFTPPFSQKMLILGPILYLEIFGRKTALTLEVLRVNGPEFANWSQGFQICGKNLPPSHRLRDTMHAQWLQTHCQWYPMGNDTTQEPIAVGSSNLVEGLITWPAMYDHWPRSEVKVTRSCNVSAAIMLYLCNRWSYQLQTWWKLSSWGMQHVTHFLCQ